MVVIFLGIIVGYCVFLVLGIINFDFIREVIWFVIFKLFEFGMEFDMFVIILVVIVSIINVV